MHIDPQHGIGLLGHLHERGVADALHVAVGAQHDGRGLLEADSGVVQRSLGLCRGTACIGLPTVMQTVARVGQLHRDTARDVVEHEGAGQPVDEKQQHEQAQDGQRSAYRHGHLR